jgi:putative spermidine/putrescine transport system ATP-binding protein
VRACAGENVSPPAAPNSPAVNRPAAPYSDPSSARVPAISITDVHKRFGDVAAVDGVTLDITQGEFFTLLGPSGSGKTTVLRMIAGFEQSTSGTIQLDGRNVTNVAPFDRDVNTVFQDYALFPHMSVLKNVEYGLRAKKVPKGERKQRALAALEGVRLSEYGARRPSELSGGQRQRVALARALVNRPKVLLLDEPLGALDLKLREEMQVELKAIQHQAGITFVFVTHDQDEALTMSDRIAVFNKGKIVQVGTPREIYESPQTRFVAGFVGTSNVIGGAIAQRALGAPGTYSIRPERLTVKSSEDVIPPGSVGLDGIVTHVQYVGSEQRLRVNLGDGSELIALVSSSSEIPPIHTKVRLIAPTSAFIELHD